ncbi:uncharacterized protein LOC110275377 [Arachis duranensis]|uniref:Uncharacterized protein LOC110275377 n=1 Tax=Arachis duranensis TaxID=130453 RepID=A0A6P5MVX8_ARADU|nr:uncharacterized protein LOC110275377 [Arachis duranensis]
MWMVVGGDEEAGSAGGGRCCCRWLWVATRRRARPVVVAGSAMVALVALMAMEQSQSNPQPQDSQTGSSRAEEEGEAPNPVQPLTPATMGDKGKRRAIAATPIGSYFKERTMPGSQPALKSVLASKQVNHKVKLGLARWIIDAQIPFNAIQSPYFQPALDGVAAIGPGFKGPSYDEMRVHLLADLKKECQLLVEGYRSSWKRTGCTLMADGWTDQRQRTLINFLVYCPAGMSFVKSVDASDMIKTADTLFKLFAEVIEWVGSSNIVHVVTNNAANYVSAGKLIHEKYPNIFWSPCAAHCINLILKDIASLPHIADLASRASKVTVFVYNHMIFLSWLRKRKEWKEIVRPGVTRFATVFITLKSIYDHKEHLQALVVDKYFTSHKLSKSVNGKMVSSIILDSKFWEDCFTTVMLVGPLIKLLRLVDADEKPSLGIVYAGMQRAKINIKTMFRNRKSAYTPYTSILKMQWDKHLKRDLHAAAYFLNPDYFYNGGDVELDVDFPNGADSSNTASFGGTSDDGGFGLSVYDRDVGTLNDNYDF